MRTIGDAGIEVFFYCSLLSERKVVVLWLTAASDAASFAPEDSNTGNGRQLTARVKEEPPNDPFELAASAGTTDSANVMSSPAETLEVS